MPDKFKFFQGSIHRSGSSIFKADDRFRAGDSDANADSREFDVLLKHALCGSRHLSLHEQNHTLCNFDTEGNQQDQRDGVHDDAWGYLYFHGFDFFDEIVTCLRGS